MNMPGFTAEASLRNSVASYRSHSLFHTEIALTVTPQMPIDPGEVRCRVFCRSHFRANSPLLKACLREC
jgi:hypothetical protein